MRKRARSIVLLAVCAAGLVACNLLAGLTEDYAFNAKGDASNPAGDGGDEGLVDPDGSKSDGPMPGMDASDSSMPQVDAAAFCLLTDSGATGYGFCDDFEEAPSTSPFGWSSTITDRDAGISIEDDAGAGMTRCLEVYLSQPGSTSTAWLAKLLPSVGAPQNLNHFQVEFDFKILPVNGIFSAGIGMLTFPSAASANREFGIAFYDTGANVSKLVTTGSQRAVDHTKFQHVKIDLDRPDGSATFSKTIVVEGVTVDTGAGIDPTGGGGSTEIRLGVFSTAPNSGNARVRFDNVVVRRW